MNGTRKRRRWPWVLLVMGILLVTTFYVAAGWYFANLIRSDALQARPYDPQGFWTGTVAAATGGGAGGSLAVLSDEEHRAQTKFDGVVMGLQFDDGTVVVVGPVSATNPDGSKTRPVVDVVGTMPRTGDSYRLTKEVWLTPEQAGLTADEVIIASPSGDFPAWEVTVPGSDRWAVLTHGRGGDRHDMLRMARPLHAAGYNLLMTTYAGDNPARPAEDGIWHFGATEWDELEAAVQHALDRGAQTLVMGGLSLGGAVTDGFLARSDLADQVDAVILDAPASSLRDTVDEAAESRSLPVLGLPIPESLENAAMFIAALRFGLDYDAVDYTAMDGLFDMPLLTFQTDGDTTIPRAVNDEFMNDGSGSAGIYVVVPGADHVLAWNVDPQAYEQAVTRFVAQLG